MPTSTTAALTRVQRDSQELETANSYLDMALGRGWRVAVHQAKSVVIVTVFDEQHRVITQERGALPIQTIRYATQRALAQRPHQ